MIAHVSLLRRFTVRFDYFDYRCDEMYVSIGSLVEVPYRNTQTLGIVVGISENSPIKTKPITAVVLQNFISEQTIIFAKKIAQIYHVSLSNALLLGIPQLPKKNREKFAHIPHTVTPKTNPQHEVVIYHQDSDLIKHSETLSQTPGTHLFIIPTQTHNQKIPHIPYISNTTPKEEKIAYLRALQSEGLYCGTRSTLFLPWKNLKSITILDEEHEGHKSWESNPRYDSTIIALLMQEVWKINLYIFSNFPKTETLYNPHVTTRKELPSSKPNTATLLTTTRTQIPPRVQEIIEEHVGLLLYITPKTEKISCMVCNDCKTSLRCYECNTPLATQREHLFCKKCIQYFEAGVSCGNCGSNSFFEAGRGAEGIYHSLSHEFPKQTITLYTAQDKNEIPSEGIVVGTKILLEKVHDKKISAIILEEVDILLTIPDYRSFDQVGSLLSRAQAVAAKHGAPLYVITKLKENEQLSRIVGQKFGAYYQEELALRKKLKLPPYTVMVNIEGKTLPHLITRLPFVETSTHNKALLNIPYDKFTTTTSRIHAILDEWCVVDVNPLRLIE